ncbi:MAG: cupin domain-containing protein [Alphaproteobacteria bacterium]
MEIGDRLRAVRQSFGLSQRALSRRCGVTNATISLIESGKLSPTFGVLKKITDGLSLDLSEFFGFEEPKSEQVFYSGGEFRELRNGKILYRQVGRDLSARALQMLYETYDPGADTGKVMLKHEGEEAGVVIEGRLEVWVGGAKRVLKAGDGYSFQSSIPHRFRNPFDETCTVVSACTPPSF